LMLTFETVQNAGSSVLGAVVNYDYFEAVWRYVLSEYGLQTLFDVAFFVARGDYD